MNFYRKICEFCDPIRACFASAGMLLLLIWGIWGWTMLTIWYLDDAPVMRFGPGSISDSSVQPFQSVVVRQSIEKLRQCPGKSIRYLTGECGHHILSEVPTVYQKGFSGEIVYAFVMPDSAQSGSCEFRMVAKYRCNLWDQWLERQSFVSPPIPFEVVRTP